MEFHEAAEIAKQNPGAILTRDGSGTFIVRFSDGRVIGCTTESKVDTDALRVERDRFDEILREARTSFEHRERELQAEIRKLEARLSKVSDAEWARIAQESQEKQEKERAEYLARDEAAKRIARSMAGRSISENNRVIFSSTDGQD
jgi:Skp family chaperone for outer membrane proteins